MDKRWRLLKYLNQDYEGVELGGFMIFDYENFREYYKTLKSYKNAILVAFDDNYIIDYTSGDDLLESIDIIEIDSNEYDMLKKLFMSDDKKWWGYFPTLDLIEINEDNDDDY